MMCSRQQAMKVSFEQGLSASQKTEAPQFKELSQAKTSRIDADSKGHEFSGMDAYACPPLSTLMACPSLDVECHAWCAHPCAHILRWCA